MNKFADHDKLMRYHWSLSVAHPYSYIPNEANGVKPTGFNDLDNEYTVSELDVLEWQLLSEFGSYDFVDTSSSFAHGFKNSDISLSPAEVESLE